MRTPHTAKRPSAILKSDRLLLMPESVKSKRNANTSKDVRFSQSVWLSHMLVSNTRIVNSAVGVPSSITQLATKSWQVIDRKTENQRRRAMETRRRRLLFCCRCSSVACSSVFNSAAPGQLMKQTVRLFRFIIKYTMLNRGRAVSHQHVVAKAKMAGVTA